MTERITSRKNDAVRAAARLAQSAAARRESGLFLCEGARLCADAALSGAAIESLFFTEKAEEKYAAYLAPIERAAKRAFLVSEPVEDLLSCTGASQGVFCVCRMAEKRGEAELPLTHCLALETLQDPGNLGTALRTAEALGIGSVLLAGECCDVYSPKVLRASMGAVFRLPIFFAESLPEALGRLSARGFFSCAAVPDSAAEPVTRVDFSCPCVMAVGNEGNGLSREAIEACDRRVTIPMLGRAESLNAASSAAILMWEMTRGGGVRRDG